MMGECDKRWGTNTCNSVIIEYGVWIGAKVTILPGVVIHRGGIVAAGAVVVDSTEPDALYAGIPARKLKDLGDE